MCIRDRPVSVDTEDQEAEGRYSGAQCGAEVAQNVAEVAENDRRRPAEIRIGDPKAAQRRDKRREEAAEGRPKQAPASPEFFGRATSPDSVYETAVKNRTKSGLSETSEAQETTEVSEQPNEFLTPKEYRRSRMASGQRELSDSESEVPVSSLPHLKRRMAIQRHRKQGLRPKRSRKFDAK